jgi:hypothetical protein
VVDYRGAASDIYAQRVDSSGAIKWTANGVAICTATNSQYDPYIVSDGSGGAIICWSDVRSGIDRMYAQRVNASGVPQWTANGVSLTNSPSGQGRPRIVSNGAGGAIVAWHDVRNGDTDIFAQRILANGTLDPAWPPGGRAIATSYAEQELGGIVPDGSGGALLTWPQWSSGLARDIFVHHVLASGVLDPAWPATGLRLFTDPYDQSLPALASDNSGGALVAFKHYRTGHEILAQHVLASGAVDPAWPDTGRVLCRVGGDQLSLRIIGSGAGGAIVTWDDSRDDVGDIYAQRVLGTGEVDPVWPEDGRVISRASLFQLLPTIVADGAGGAVLAWEDRRTAAGQYGDDGEVFAQGVKANGQLGTFPTGVVDEPRTDFAIQSPYPHPLRTGSMIVRFTLPKAAAAVLEMFDIAGRRVIAREVGTLGAGPHAIDLAAERRGIPGVYFLRLTQGSLTRVRRIVVVD